MGAQGVIQGQAGKKFSRNTVGLGTTYGTTEERLPVKISRRRKENGRVEKILF